MKTIGSLILLVSVALFIVIGISSFNDVSDQATTSNDSHIVAQTASVNAVTNPIIYVFGFLIVIIGAVIAIDAYR
jgi:hypothetical protein